MERPATSPGVDRREPVDQTRAHEIAGTTWQRGYFDRIMRSDEDLRAKAEYIVANPVRAGLVERVEDYPWIWRWWVEGG